MNTNKIEQIQHCIDKAIKRESKLTDEVLSISSMTSLNIRHFLNNIGGYCENFLEIGTFVGGTFCSTIFENGNIKTAYCIDNFSEFDFDGETEQKLKENIKQYQHKNTFVSFQNIDCFLQENLPENHFDLYAYDGNHSEDAHKKAIVCFKDNMKNEFILLVDDWAFDGVEKGTRDGIKEANLTILFESIQVTPQGEQHNEHWHNNYAIFLLKKIK
jgi:hypothetical protein